MKKKLRTTSYTKYTKTWKEMLKTKVMLKVQIIIFKENFCKDKR